LNTIPTEENTLRNRPVHSGQAVSDESVKRCTASNRCPQAVQAYW
jgi:hypothetical protein